ncbi:MAG: exodeoxyribonuclease V subunit gamma [Deltaproteobacteria bacterium]|nr:exodeoxyribonuclease V subunit gamma [Deltaproteobacteria bacterium]
MFVHRSNRMEVLVEALAEVVRPPLRDPFAAECIIVQGRGMERWLSMQLAQSFGVWANPDFPFPRKFIERCFADTFADDGSKRYDPAVLLWTIADLLPGLLARDEFAEVRSYLERAAVTSPPTTANEVGLHLIALAERVAAALDQYAVFRPQWTAEWEKGRAASWQALLWQKIVQRHGPNSVAARAQRWLRALATVDAAQLPQRLCLFGVSTLPPLYLNLFASLAARVEVHLFVLSPSREYWAWVRSRREIWRQLLRDGRTSVDFEAAAAEAEGNPLLASLGRLGRDFQQIIEAGVDYQDDDSYGDPGITSMLSTLQSDILNLRHRRRGKSEATPLPVDPADDSIRIHACHSPMREVEVLHDQLLDLFERDRTTEPRDVIVLSPDIDAYAPFVDAVFGVAGTAQPRIPYRIADRRVRSTDDVVDTFLGLLGLIRGRFSGPDIVDLLSRQPVYRQFGIVAEEIDVVREWVREAGIRWGIDAEHRAALQQPPLVEHTWRFGLDRLLLGYAMRGDQRCLFRDVLPFDDMEGSVSELLGKLVECLDRLFTWRRRLEAPRSLAQWRDDLAAALAALLANTDDTAHQHRQIRAALAELAQQAEDGGFGGRVDLESVRLRLEASLENAAPGRDFLTGGVTFCAMVPMRSIPFRVVCLLGMNDGAFPRPQRPLSFDLMLQQPLPGDRSGRDDDRHLFLEALLAARERLIITYVGQSVRDNAEIPPSVVVSELLDVIGESFTRDAEAPLPSAPLVIRHPLQPFSRHYFDGRSDLFSYAQPYFAGALRLGQQRDAAAPFVVAPLPVDADAERTVTVDELARFFENPARGFLQRRLSLSLGTDVESLDDREPLQPDALERWQIGTRLLEWAVEGDDLEASLPALRASGMLPPGRLGEYLWNSLRTEVDGIARAAASYTSGNKLDPVEIDLRLDDTRIVGSLRHVWPSAQLQCQFSKLGGYHELGLWIRHLLLNLVSEVAVPRTTVLVGRADKNESTVVQLMPVKEASGLLRDLLSLYWLGQRLPLPFFRYASRAFSEVWRKSGNEEKAFAEARKRLGDEHNFGDRHDAYVEQVYGNRDPLATPIWRGEIDLPTFGELARRIWGPLLDHRKGDE